MLLKTTYFTTNVKIFVVNYVEFNRQYIDTFVKCGIFSSQCISRHFMSRQRIKKFITFVKYAILVAVYRRLSN